MSGSWPATVSSRRRTSAASTCVTTCALPRRWSLSSTMKASTRRRYSPSLSRFVAPATTCEFDFSSRQLQDAAIYFCEKFRDVIYNQNNIVPVVNISASNLRSLLGLTSSRWCHRVIACRIRGSAGSSPQTKCDKEYVVLVVNELPNSAMHVSRGYVVVRVLAQQSPLQRLNSYSALFYVFFILC